MEGTKPTEDNIVTSPINTATTTNVVAPGSTPVNTNSSETFPPSNSNSDGK